MFSSFIHSCCFKAQLHSFFQTTIPLSGSWGDAGAYPNDMGEGWVHPWINYKFITGRYGSIL